MNSGLSAYEVGMGLSAQRTSIWYDSEEDLFGELRHLRDLSIDGSMYCFGHSFMFIAWFAKYLWFEKVFEIMTPGSVQSPQSVNQTGLLLPPCWPS